MKIGIYGSGTSEAASKIIKNCAIAMICHPFEDHNKIRKSEKSEKMTSFDSF